MKILKHLYDRVDAAEAALLAARDQLRAAAEREGFERAGLFSDSKFVLRTSAESWSKEARREGADKTREEIESGLRHLVRKGLLRQASPGESYQAEAQADQMLAELVIAASKKHRGEV